MYISVWTKDLNPAIDPRAYRRSRVFCRAEVAAGRAIPVDEEDIERGIWLRPDRKREAKSEMRGSEAQRGCLTAFEMQLNAARRTERDKVGKAVAEGRACLIVDNEVARLMQQYETRLDKHMAEGKPGTPGACALIAARVKTLMSDPRLARMVTEMSAAEAVAQVSPFVTA